MSNLRRLHNTSQFCYFQEILTGICSLVHSCSIQFYPSVHMLYLQLTYADVVQ